MVPWYILWPLRNAAVAPAMLGLGLAVGASYGSWDLTYKVTRAALPKAQKPRKYSRFISGTSAITTMGAAAWVRETLFPPSFVAPPQVPVEGPLEARIRAATAVFLHQVINYPYKHRFQTAFIAGSVGGIVGALAEWAYNRPRIAKEEGKVMREEPRGSGAVHRQAGPVNSTAQVTYEEEGVEHRSHADTFQSASLFKPDEPVSFAAPEAVSGAEAEQAQQGQAARPQQAHDPWHGHDYSQDPLAALGLYGHQDDRRSGRGAASHAGSSAGPASAQAAGQASSAALHQEEDEFLETYSDRYSGTGERDVARGMENYESGQGAPLNYDPYARDGHGQKGQARHH